MQWKTCALMAALFGAVAWAGGNTLGVAGASQKGVTVHRGDRAERAERQQPAEHRRYEEKPEKPEEELQRDRDTTPDHAAVDAPSGRIAFYVFGGSGAEAPGLNRRLMRAGSWPAWAEGVVEELPEGCTRVWIHNPFGIYEKPGGDRWMWIDQWVLAQDTLPEHLTDAEEFAQAVQILRDHGICEVVAYVGSPLTLPVEDRTYEHVSSLIRPLLDAGCSIGFDATYDWRKGDETDQLIQAIRTRGHRVYVEPWLYGDREYGPIDGVVHLDRFFPLDEPRTRMSHRPIVLDPDCERVVIQRNYSANELRGIERTGATLAARPWTSTGRDLLSDASE